MKLSHASVLALFVLAVSWSAGANVATAQVSTAPLAPQQPFARPSPKFAVDQKGNLVIQRDEPTTPPNDSGQSMLEIPQVPQEFKGCWEATVSQADSWQHLQGPRIGGWIPTTIRLCFRRVGDGPFTITFHDTKLDTDYASEHGYTVSNFDEQTEVVSTDGKNQVKLHGVARMDQRGRILGFIPGPTVTIAATSDSSCVLIDGGEAINVEATQVERCSGSAAFDCNGEPWIQATWHARFHRTTDPSSPNEVK
jgi:hypothetical protein